MLNLDTHILLNAIDGTLRAKERHALRDQWSISAIVIWEIAKLHQLGRIALSLDHAGLTKILERIHVWPISIQVCRAISALDFSSDPADEIIAATSVVHGVKLLTRDRRILRSKLVPMVRG
ncbi:MAG: PIN domain-containing protein [Deltaproteobacteria bacterium]|nr:PIN domain-containing protein [Deltaproteobacteria bacterium]